MKTKKSRIFKGAVSIIALISLSVPLNVGATSNIDYTTKIDSVLLEKMENCSDTDTIPVSAWFTDIDYDEVNTETVEVVKDEISDDVLDIVKASGDDNALLSLNLEEQEKSLEEQKADSLEMQTAITARREIASEMQKENNDKIMDKLFSLDEMPEIIYSCKYAPNVEMYLTKEQINDIVKSSNVVELYYADPNIQLSTDATTETETTASSTEIAAYPSYFEATGITNTRKIYGLLGGGVNVGVYDNKFTLPSGLSYFARNNVVDYKIEENRIVEDYTYSHGSAVACLIAGTKKDNDGNIVYAGAAPYANMYWTAGYNYKESLEYLVDKGCNVINVSMAIYYNDTDYNIYNDISAWVEHITVEDSVHIVVSSGKYGSNGVYGFNLASNAITVGNCDNSGVLNDSSSYSDLNTLPYKPDLVAPGVNIQTPAGTLTGTSLSAPIVTGAVAQFCQLSAVLRDNPTLMKALLLSGSKRTQYMIDNNVQSVANTFSIALDHKYGSGILNTINMYVSFNDKSYYSTGVMHNTESAVTITQRLSVPNSKYVRIAVVWDRYCVLTSSKHDEAYAGIVDNDNMFIRVTAPDGTYYDTYSNKDTKALISFPATSATGNYTIELTRLSNSTYDINYAVSCSVTRVS